MTDGKRSNDLILRTLRARSSRRELVRRGAALGLSATAVSALMARSVGAQGTPPAFNSELSGEITFWHGLGTEAEVVTNTILPLFEEQFPNVSVNVLQVPFDQLQNKYNTEASAGGGPDVLLGPSDWIGGFVEADIILPLGDLMDEELRAGYNDASLSGVTFEDTLYAVPQNINGVALFYNTDLVQNPPKTTEELKSMAGELATGPDQYGFGLVANFYSNAGYLYGYGGDVLTEDGQQSAFDSEATVRFLTLLQELAQTEGVFTQADQGAVESLFQEGQVAMMFNGPWFLQGARDALGAEKVGVALLPAISDNDNAPARPFVGVQGLYINSNLDPEQAELAFEFARWFSTVGTQILVDEAGQLPASPFVTVPEDEPAAETFVEQYEVGVALPTAPLMQSVWTPAGDMITKVIEGQASPEEAAQEAAETINSAG